MSTQEKNRYAQVVLAIESSKTQDTYTYSVPGELRPVIQRGSLVLVPVKNNLRTGVVIELKSKIEKTSYEIKDLISVYGPDRILDEVGIRLAKWVAMYYHCSLYSAVRLLFWDLKSFKITASYQLNDPETFYSLISEKIGLFGKPKKSLDSGVELTKSRLRATLRDCQAYGAEQEELLNELLTKKILTPIYQLARSRARKEKLAYLPAETKPLDSELNETEEELLLTINDFAKPVTWEELKKDYPDSRKVFNKLVEKGFVIETCIPSDTTFDEESDKQIILNKDQQSAIRQISDSIETDKCDTFLIEGVTGSGKTEIYIECAKKALRKGSVIVLVPEIVLTLQIVSQFKRRFGDCLTVLHSGLGQAQLKRNWEILRQSRNRIVIGPRSALFAPLADIKLIIIDEEHEPAYKQDRTPRYHARDVARRLAHLRQANLVLGSATPSVESRWMAEIFKYQFLELPERIHKGGLPDVKMLKLKGGSAEGPQFLSPELINQVRKTLERNKQVLLFLNQRGFSPSLLCISCGFTPKCPHCDIAYTFHAKDFMLLCHHCDHRIAVPRSCPSCGGDKILKLGFGTQRVESEVSKLFPDARVYRLDRDVASRGGIEGGGLALMKKFFDERGEILVGTQMIGKGLDLPDVELVGIVNADTSLNLPDFRAAERTFQLITQVAGRAGRRDQKGLVILQTYKPGHYAIEAARMQDFETFFEREIEIRKTLNYPPFVSLARLVFRGAKDEDTRKQIQFAAEVIRDFQIRKVINLISILGPSPAPLEKIAGKYRHHMILKASRISDLIGTVRRLENRMKLLKGVYMDIDINPLNML